jgi:uncharacterized protein
MERRQLADAFIDTSFVIALVNKTDQHHRRAHDLANLFDKRKLVTTDAVLLEIGNALARNFKAESVKIIDHFLTSDEVQVVHLHPRLFRNAFELYQSHLDKTWGLVDCSSFVVMKDMAITDALTTDKHFEQAGFRSLVKV